MNTKDHSVLAEASASIQSKLKGLSPKAAEMRLRALANRPAGYGAGQITPLEKSFAQQALDVAVANAALASNAAAHEELRRSPPRSMAESDRLVALKALEDKRDRLHVELLSIAERSHQPAAAETLKAHAAHERDQARGQAILEAAEAQADAIKLPQHAVDALARRLAAKP